jgi:putative two-component system response regulator
LAAGADDFISKPFQPEELNLRCEAGLRVLSLESRDVVIFALAKLAESRDNETGQHIERVQRYCGLLAKTLRNEGEFPNQIDSEFIRLLFETCPLHDVGKVAIPDAILLKPGLLTKEEFEIMKTHTTIGAQTLQAALDRFPTAKFLQCAVDIAWSHHEKFDGSGYPRGLKGDDIPLTARIVAVADVYDALTSKRVYKEAYSHSTAVELIREQSGKHFDPRIVRCFELSADGFNTIREEHQDTGKDLKFPYLPKSASTTSNSEANDSNNRK